MHRRIYFVLFVALFASAMGTGFIGPLMPLYARELGARGLSLGLIFTGFSLAQFISMPIVGRLSDHHGRRLFLVVGLSLYTLFSLAYSVASGVAQLIAVRVLHGAAAGMVNPVAQAYIADITPKGEEGSRLGAFNVALFTAFGLGPLLGGPVADLLGIRAPFYAMGSLSLVALLLVILLLPEAGLHGAAGEKRARTRTIIRDPMVKAAFLFRALVAFGRGLVIPFLPFVAEGLGASLSVIGALLATNIILAGVLQIPFGKTADRVSRPALMGIGILSMAALIFSIPYCRSVAALFALQIATGVTMAIGMPAGLAVAAERGRHHNAMGTSMALFTSGMSVGLIVAPVAGGALSDMFGLDFVFFGGSLVVIAGFAAFAALVRSAAAARPALQRSAS
ncbi:MAG: MFS transporter [Candidatus Eisenbacteria bacterium]|nr:MFS transporter [Candidatus Eisenbacteria bacterium]